MSDQESEDDQIQQIIGQTARQAKAKVHDVRCICRYNQMEEEYYPLEQNAIANERRSARAIKKNYAATMSEEDEPINQPVEETEVKRIFVPEIDQILCRKIDQNTSQILYLVKFKNRSYLHTEWLNEDRILEEKNGKQKINRFNKVFEKRIQEEIDDFLDDQYFDPAFQEVDRVLSCTEIFPIVHPKKGSEMKGKWAESLTKVMSHLLNFSRDQIHYGVYFLEQKTFLDFGTINNRLYLGQYKNYSDFWCELGSVFKAATQEWQVGTEMNKITNTLIECAIVLFNIWYRTINYYHQSKLIICCMMKQNKTINLNYNSKEKINDAHRKDIMPELKKEKINELVSKVLIIIEDKQYNLQEHSKEIEIILEQELNIKLQIQNDQEFDLEDYLKQSLQIQDIDVAQEMQLEMQDFQSQMDVVDPDIESWNPGEKSFEWLNESQEEIQILTKEEIQNLQQEPDKLYFVKWKHLSYLEATWEPESLIDCRQKIQEFKQFNRSLDKETRNLMMQQNLNHKTLIDYDQGIKKKKLSNMQIQDIKSQLYFLNYTQIDNMIFIQSKIIVKIKTQSIYYNKNLLMNIQTK